MADMHGKGGLARIGALPLGHLQKWSYKETADLVDCTTMQDSKKRYKKGIPDGTLDFSVNWDLSDAGQAAVSAAVSGEDEVTIEIYPDGTTVSGSVIVSGDIMFNSEEIDGDVAGLVSGKFSGQGVMTKDTVSA